MRNEVRKAGFFLRIVWNPILCLTLSLFAMIGCDNSSIRYADQNAVLSKVHRFNKIKDSVVSFQKVWQQNAMTLQAKANEISTTLTDLKNLKPAQIDSLAREQQRLTQDLQRYTKVNMEKGAKLEQELMAPEIPKLNACLQEFLEKNDIDYLLGTQQGGVILASRKSNDWTDRVTEYLNKNCQ